MRPSVLFLLPAVAFSFAPLQPVPFQSKTRLFNVVTEVASDITSKTETVIGKADNMILKRAMRIVNHLPAVVTLKCFAEAAGSSKYGVDIAASTFSYASPDLLSVPTWLGNVWPVICVAQIASLAKSALASDSDEVDQGGISALAFANFGATKALTSATPLRWVLATSILSGYSARNGGDGDLTVHTAASQLMSSITTAMTILGGVAALPNLVPFLSGQPEILAGVGLAAFYSLATRDGNGLVKKIINAGVIGGILASKIAEGALKLTFDNLFSVGTLVTIGTAYVAYEALVRAKDALF